MKQFLARLAPQNLPQSEPEALAGAVLGGNSRRVAGWIPATWWLLTAGLSYVGLLGFALAGHLQGTVACFVVAGLSDWAASRGTTRLSQLLRLAGWGEPLRSLIRWALLLSVLSQPLAVTVPLAAQAAALTLAVATQWLHQRQPPLRYLPGIADQPAETLAYARAYQRGSGWPAALLAADMAGALIAGLIPSPGLLIAIAAAVLGYAGVGLLAALRLGSRAEDDAATAARLLDERQPDSAVYVSGGLGQAKYLFNPWAGAFNALANPPLVIVREANHLVALSPTNGVVMYAPASRQVEVVWRPSIRVAFYLANGQKNGDLLRNAGLTHVFLGHGDSDKATSASPIARVYDEIWVAGQAAINRYREAGIRLPDSAFIIVGRPQTASMPVGPTGNQRPVVLYAPTFEGYAESMNYSSLLTMGAPLIERLLEHDPPVTVWFRPHPSTGVQRADIRATRQRINALIRGAGAPHRTVDDDPDESLLDSLVGCDLLITDVSSVSSDFLHTERPIVVTDPAGLGREEFVRRFPSQRAAYTLGPGVDGVERTLAEALSSDPLLPGRRALKTEVLGDLPNGAVAAFVSATGRLVTSG